MNASPTIAGILFDKDGTLLDYARSWLPVNREIADYAAQGDAALAHHLLARCGMDPITGHVVPDSLLAAGNSREIAEGFAAAGSPLGADEITDHIDGIFASAASRAVPVTELRPLFERLRALGYRLGIASSDNERSIRHTATRFGIDDLIDDVAGYDSGYGTKPEPGMVHGFCRATGLEPGHVAVVGDNNHDLHMALAAGAGLRVGVLTGTGSRESLAAAAHHCLNDITELETILPARG